LSGDIPFGLTFHTRHVLSLIEQHIEVEKLCRAKYQDNLEFMQWLKSFFDKNYSGAPYDPVARRAVGKGENRDGVAAVGVMWVFCQVPLLWLETALELVAFESLHPRAQLQVL
jgi:hypothetical protein